MKYWSIREELYISFHQWPVMILFFVLGSLIGWGLSLLLPVSYKASSQLFVALNPYRAYTDSNFVALAKPKYSNIDDYKNWQMSELESLMFLDEVLDKTLTELQSTDPNLNTTDIDQFQEMLDAEWRSAGTWSLIVEGSNPEQAERVVQTWSQVTLESVSDSTKAALRTFMIDEELKNTIKGRADAESRLRILKTLGAELQEWTKNTSKSQTNQPLDLDERWYIESLAAGAADFSPGWLALLDKQPNDEEPGSAYLIWIAQILEFIDRETLVLEGEIVALKEQQSFLEDQYMLEFQKSKGISPNLVVEELRHLPTKQLHPARIFALIGGIIGFFLWIFVRLVIITRKFNR